MKTTFTLYFLVVFTVASVAENPFKKEKRHHAKFKVATTLKAAVATENPMGMTTYNWSGTDWFDPSVYTFTYNAEGLLETSFNDYNKMIYAYDVSGQVTSVKTQYWDGSMWINSNEERYTYDSEGNETENGWYSWSGSDWVLEWGYRNVYEYENGEQISVISSHYNSGTMTWEEDWGWKDEYVRDVQDRLISEKYYDRVGGAWVLEYSSDYYYDAQGRVEYSIELEGGSSMSMKFVYMYDAQDVLIEANVYEVDGEIETLLGRYTSVVWAIWNPDGFTQDSYIESVILQVWDADGGVFVNAEKEEGDMHGYTGTGTPPVFTSTYSEWNGSSWDYVSRETRYDGNYDNYMEEEYIAGNWYVTSEYRDNSTYWRYFYASYDGSGNILSGSHDETIFDAFGAEIESFNKTNDGTGWVQIYGSKTIITYEGATPKVLEKIYQSWDGDTEMYVNYMREVYDYTATNLDLLAKEGIKIYPTAFKNNVAVQSAYSGKVMVYNLAGAKVIEKPINSGVNSIDGAKLESGIYIIKVVTSQGQNVQKVIKQ
ncbi:T9SS type A sorting domain-containing protein [Carboxylicivirga caseinilyticus]|uniref:T9SS type A sorting domain-containing protein n=1 Tax=Carboxylicivirga caseinilyticus TaxID=3417572 RepID=UPI003D33FB1C|nr:T9SS type A sorting domain-containing protein [Marinilabiliaceae bacterium A049]